jgi:hypothetical protein
MSGSILPAVVEREERSGSAHVHVTSEPKWQRDWIVGQKCDSFSAWKRQHTNTNSSGACCDNAPRHYFTTHSPADPTMGLEVFRHLILVRLRLSSPWAPQTAFIGAAICKKIVFAEVTTWSQALVQDFFTKGFSALFSLWNKFLSRGWWLCRKIMLRWLHVYKQFYICGNSPDALSQCYGVLFPNEELASPTVGRTILMFF